MPGGNFVIAVALLRAIAWGGAGREFRSCSLSSTKFAETPNAESCSESEGLIVEVKG